MGDRSNHIRRRLTERESAAFLTQIQASLRTMVLPVSFGDPVNHTSYLSVQVSMTISDSSQEAFAFTYRIEAPIIVQRVVLAPAPTPGQCVHNPTQAHLHITPSSSSSSSSSSAPPVDDPVVVEDLNTPSWRSTYGCGICDQEYVNIGQRAHCNKCRKMICKTCAEKMQIQRCPYCRYVNFHWPQAVESSSQNFSDESD